MKVIIKIVVGMILFITADFNIYVAVKGLESHRVLTVQDAHQNLIFYLLTVFILGVCAGSVAILKRWNINSPRLFAASLLGSVIGALVPASFHLNEVAIFGLLVMIGVCLGFGYLVGKGIEVGANFLYDGVE